MSDKNFKVKNGIDVNGASTISSSSISDTTLSINSISGQYSSIQLWKVVGSPAIEIDSNGHFYTLNGRGVFVNSGWIGSTRFAVTPWQSSAVGMIIKGQSSQTGDLTQWQNSDGTVLAKIDSSGSITAADLTLSGNLTVNGTTTNLNSTNLVIEDKNIIIADVATPTDTTADGAGITIKGATDKTFNWVQSTGSFTSSEPLIINTNSTTRPNLILKPIASQTSAVQEWQSSTGAVLANIDKSGYFRGPLVEVSPTNPALYGVAIAANASQTGDLFQITDSSNNAYTGVSSTGKLVTGNTTNVSRFTQITDAALGQLTVYSPSASTKGLVIKGAASQTADLQQWQYNDGTIAAKINGAGQFVSNVGFAVIAGNYGGAVGSFLSSNAAYIGLIVKGASSQTANLQEWQNNSGSVLANIDSTGRFLSTRPFRTDDVITAGSQTVTLGQISAIASSSSRIGLVVRGAASQTANLQEWQDSSGTILAHINAAGALNLNYAVSSTLTTPIVLENSSYGTGTGTQMVFKYGGLNYASISSIYSGTPSGPDMVFNVGSTTSSRMRIDNNGTVTINGFAASAQGLIIKGAAGQTGNFQEWQHTSGSVLNYVSSGGVFNFNSYGDTAGSGYSHIIIGGRVIRNEQRAAQTKFNVTTGEWQFAGGAAESVFFITDNQVGIFANSTNLTSFVIRSAASQTANLQEWQNSSGTALGWFNAYGSMQITNSFNGARAELGNTGVAQSSTLVLKIQGVSGQTANLTEWQNSAGTVLSNIDKDGNITAPSYNLSDSKYLLRKTIKKTVNPAGNAVANNTYDLFDMNFPSSLQGTFYIQASIRGPGYGQNLTYSLPATYIMDWINQYPITNPFTNSTTWVDLTPLTFSPRHLMTNDYFKFQAKVNLNQISFRIKLTGTLTGAPVFDIYIQHSEEFANSTITELNTTGTDATTSNVMPNFLSSKAGLSAIFNPITLYSNSASNTPLTVKGVASQTANLTEWQDSTGTLLGSVQANGNARFVSLSNLSSSNYSLISLTSTGTVISSGQTGITPLYIKNTAASATANLTEWQNSAGATMAKVDSNGYFTSGIFYANSNHYAGYQIIGGRNVLNIDGLTAMGMVNWNTGLYTLYLKNVASQTADSLRIENSSGTAIARIDASGNLSAVTKSFDIPHPTKENMRLRYASLEGPENGVYIRGTAESNIIELPEYWTGLVHEDSITVSLTAVGSAQNIYVEKIEDNKVYIGGELTKAFFTVYGERKDIDKLTVEY